MAYTAFDLNQTGLIMVTENHTFNDPLNLFTYEQGIVLGHDCLMTAGPYILMFRCGDMFVVWLRPSPYGNEVDI